MHSVEAVWNPCRFWISEHVVKIPEKSYHWQTWAWMPVKHKAVVSSKSCKSPFLAASSYHWSQFLWHRAFRQSLSVSFVLLLIYSFKQWQPHSKTMARKLRVELTSIIMQIWGKKSPIVTHSSKFLPPPVLDIQVNKLLVSRKYSNFPLQDPLGTTAHHIMCVRIFGLQPPRPAILVYVCITDHFHIVISLMYPRWVHYPMPVVQGIHFLKTF